MSASKISVQDEGGTSTTERKSFREIYRAKKQEDRTANSNRVATPTFLSHEVNKCQSDDLLPPSSLITPEATAFNISSAVINDINKPERVLRSDDDHLFVTGQLSSDQNQDNSSDYYISKTFAEPSEFADEEYESTESYTFEIAEEKVSQLTSEQSTSLVIAHLVRQLTPEDFLLTDLDSVIKPSLQRTRDYRKLYPLYSELQSRAKNVEEVFQNHNVSGSDVDTMPSVVDNLEFSVPVTLSEPVRDALLELIEKLSTYYAIPSKTLSEIGALLEEAVTHYCVEMEFVLDNNEPENFASTHEEIRTEALRNFSEAVDFRDSFWKWKYKDILSQRINDAHRKFLEGNRLPGADDNLTDGLSISEEINAALQTYRLAFEDEKKLRDVNSREVSGSLADIHRRAKLKARHRLEVDLVKSKMTVPDQIRACLNDLENQANQIFARECLSENSSNEGQTAPSAGNDNQRYVYSFSNPSNQKHSHGGAGTSWKTCFVPPASASSTKPSKELELALHFGYTKTLVGVFDSNEKNFMKTYEISNDLYLEDSFCMVKFTNGYSPKGNPISLQSLLQAPSIMMDQPSHPVSDSSRGSGLRSYRIEELLGCFLISIKWQVEAEFSREFPDVVLCIPQCMNSDQKRIVWAGLFIAGFEGRTFIKDTSAIAVAYMMQKSLTFGDIVATSTFDGFIDTARFSLRDGVAVGEMVSGTFYLPEKSNNVFTNLFAFISGKKKSGKELSRIDEVFSFVNKTAQHSRGNTESSPTVWVVSGDNEAYQQIYTVLDSHFGAAKRTQVTHSFPLVGASYLSALLHSNPKNQTYQQWTNLTVGTDVKSYETALNRLKYFLLQAQTPLQSRQEFQNESKHIGIHLSDQQLNRLQESFFMRKKLDLHRRKLSLLKKAEVVQLMLSMDRNIEAVFMKKASVESITSDLQTQKFDHDKLDLYENNLDELSNQ